MDKTSPERTIQITIDEARELVELKNSIDRLRKNRDFKRVFERKMFEDEPARLTRMLTDTVGENDRSGYMEDLIIISGVQSFLRSWTIMGNTAERQLAEAERIQEEMAQEERDGEL